MNMAEDCKNYYEVLEVSMSSSQEDVYSGYVRARNAYTGDSIALYSLMTEDECHRQLELIEEAYSVLSVPEKRREYDKVRGFDQLRLKDRIEREGNSDLLRQGSQGVMQDEDGNQHPLQERRNASDRRGSERRQHSFESDFDLRKNEVVVSQLSASNKYALDFESNAEFEQEIEECVEFTGEMLKRIREYKNVSIERMSEITRVSKTYIRSLEGEDYNRLPAVVYIRGFVMQYAKILKLDADKVTKTYIERLKKLKENGK